MVFRGEGGRYSFRVATEECQCRPGESRLCSESENDEVLVCEGGWPSFGMLMDVPVWFLKRLVPELTIRGETNLGRSSVLRYQRSSALKVSACVTAATLS